jgi:hypothetical protein
MLPDLVAIDGGGNRADQSEIAWDDDVGADGIEGYSDGMTLPRYRFRMILKSLFCSEPRTPASIAGPVPQDYWFTLSLKNLPTENLTVLAAAMVISAPVLGLHPLRSARLPAAKVPKPTNCTDSPLATAAITCLSIESSAHCAGRSNANRSALSSDPEDVRLRNKLRGIYGVVFRLDAATPKKFNMITSETGRRISGAAVLSLTNVSHQTYTDNSMPIPKTIHATWRDNALEYAGQGV